MFWYCRHMQLKQELKEQKNQWKKLECQMKSFRRQALHIVHTWLLHGVLVCSMFVQLMLPAFVFIPCLSKKPGPYVFPQWPHITAHLLMSFGRGIDIQLPTNCRWNVWYWLRTICAVSIETVLPLETMATCEQIKWYWMKKIIDLFRLNIYIVK